MVNLFDNFFGIEMASPYGFRSGRFFAGTKGHRQSFIPELWGKTQSVRRDYGNRSIQHLNPDSHQNKSITTDFDFVIRNGKLVLDKDCFIADIGIPVGIIPETDQLVLPVAAEPSVLLEMPARSPTSIEDADLQLNERIAKTNTAAHPFWRME